VDVLSAVLTFLAVHIRRESNPLGVTGIQFHLPSLTQKLGNIAKTFVKGDKDCDSVDADLQVAIIQFNAAFSHYSSSIILRTFDAVEGIVIYPISCSFKVFDRILQQLK
jgi:hypothetical protein